MQWLAACKCQPGTLTDNAPLALGQGSEQARGLVESNARLTVIMLELLNAFGTAHLMRDKGGYGLFSSKHRNC
jgi:hypothetical protein